MAIGDVSYGPLSEKWKPLDATATEADAVSSAFHAKFEKGEVRLLKQLDAHEEEINRLLPGSRYVHLATHGFFVPQPGTDQFGVQTWIAQLQSGLIVAPPPSSGQTSDQYLTAEEIGRLDLRGTELVVLSACESGRGSIQSGQGMVGLQQSFISAGAKGVISSLWKVDDLATAELMRLFYYYLWRENTNPSEALRRAQQALRANSQFAPSGYWAAFTFTQP